jgi:hypothetical protein
MGNKLLGQWREGTQGGGVRQPGETVTTVANIGSNPEFSVIIENWKTT